MNLAANTSLVLRRFDAGFQDWKNNFFDLPYNKFNPGSASVLYMRVKVFIQEEENIRPYVV
jgi:hypothetical protein